MSDFSTDVLIIGGGIAGLWLNAHLRRQGYATLLLEQACLGGGQTVKSQGIIHGGTKYALHGLLTGSSEAIARMPECWRAALAGQGAVDLSGVAVRSEAHYLWSPNTLTGQLTGFFASKAMRERIHAVSESERPEALKHPDFRGRVYRLAELVLDVPSLLKRLIALSGDSLLAAPTLQPAYDNAHQLVGFYVQNRRILAQRIVLCAGAGNEALLQQLGLSQPAMQRRPLHMVMVGSKHLKPLYAHCMGHGPKPRVTVTTHDPRDGSLIWYLGGDLAESSGVARTEAEQIRFAQQELHSLLPWINLNNARWATVRVDRAEPAQQGLTRPDSASLTEHGRLLVGWPTKLALAPDLSTRVLHALQQAQIQPQGHVPTAPQGVRRPEVAAPFWEGYL